MNAKEVQEMRAWAERVNKHIDDLADRVAALEDAQPEPLVFPTIDLGLVEGTK
jgi:hypothetical protein